MQLCAIGSDTTPNSGASASGKCHPDTFGEHRESALPSSITPNATAISTGSVSRDSAWRTGMDSRINELGGLS